MFLTFLILSYNHSEPISKRALQTDFIKRLSARSKCYWFSISRVPRIQKIFLVSQLWSPTILSCVLFPLHFEIHFAGPVMRATSATDLFTSAWPLVIQWYHTAEENIHFYCANKVNFIHVSFKFNFSINFFCKITLRFKIHVLTLEIFK